MQRIVGLGLLLLLAPARAGAETAVPPPPDRWVTDRAAFLSAAAVTELDARLGVYAQSTGHQVVVYVDRTTGGVPIEDWAVRAFQAWRVGRRGIDDGVAMFVFADDHRVRIEVGYGLEGTLPDAVTKRIIDERIVPRIRAGDHDGAIRGGIDALLARVGGETPGAGRGAADQAPAPIRVPLWKLIAGALALVALIGFAITHPALAWLLLLNIGSGRGGGGGGGWGGGGGGGGGFSGGGGRSGGGGASGSW